MLRTIAILISVLSATTCMTQTRSPQSLTCAEQLADLSKQYAKECAPKFGRPPACDKCPTDSASCVAKCNECKIIYEEMKKKEDQCGR